MGGLCEMETTGDFLYFQVLGEQMFGFEQPCRAKGDEIASGDRRLRKGGLRIGPVLYTQCGVGDFTQPFIGKLWSDGL